MQWQIWIFLSRAEHKNLGKLYKMEQNFNTAILLRGIKDTRVSDIPQTLPRCPNPVSSLIFL